MKRLIAVILSVIMLLSLVACNGGGDDAVIIYHQENTVQTVNAGNIIMSDSMEIKINRVELTYDVLPDDTSSFYTHYEASAGKVFIAVDASITNKTTQNLKCDKIGQIVANYNNGSTYPGLIVVKASKTELTNAYGISIAPSETKGIKWLVECPEEVKTSSNPLFLEFTISNGKYKLVIR